MASPRSGASSRSAERQIYANGTVISKVFVCPKTGKERTFLGEVKRFEEVEGRLLYWVKYEDGDAEHMSEREVQKCMASNVASKPSARLQRKPRFAKGTLVSKKFLCPETGRETVYHGKVKRFEPVQGQWRYWIKYEDGDTEHMSEREVANHRAIRAVKREMESEALTASSSAKRSRISSDDGTQDGKRQQKSPIHSAEKVRHVPKVKEEPAPSLQLCRFNDVGKREKTTDKSVASASKARGVRVDRDDRKIKAKRKRSLNETPSEDLRDVAVKDEPQEEDPVSALVGTPRVHVAGEVAKKSEATSRARGVRVDHGDRKVKAKRQRRLNETPSEDVRDVPVKEEPQEEDLVSALCGTPSASVASEVAKKSESTSKARGVSVDCGDRKVKAKRQRRLNEPPPEDVRNLPVKEESQGGDLVSAKVREHRVNESQEEDPVTAKVRKHRGNDTREVANKSQNSFVAHRNTPVEALPKEAPTAPVVDSNEKCPICERAPMKKPRATLCHHLFCKACIQGYYSQNDHFCPVCRLPGELKLTRSSDSPAFKPVEALNKLSGEVVHSFGSASAASMKLAKAKGRAVRIIDACQSRRRDDREFIGFYWRFRGSRDRILRLGEAIRDGIPIEQVCLETGKVLNVFASSREAYEKTGVARCSIRRVLDREGKANAGGFFWRFTGEKHNPWPDPAFEEKTAVEQLSLETGEVLASFCSLADAKRHMGMRPNSGCIRECCNGERRSVFGFFFRWKGSDSMPLLKYRGKRVQLSKTKGGKVLKEFPNALIASEVFGVDFSKICRWCREEERAVGYWWRYDPEHPDPSAIPQGERLVGKRISLLEGGEWIEGKLIEYHGRDDSHSIQRDRGDVIRFMLSKAEYELKNDQGQKPVEQLDKDTGEVLNTFPSISAAKQTVSETAQISGVLQGHYVTAGGFFWRYKGSTAQPRKPKTRKVVEQLCLKTGRVLATHKSISAAGKAVGISTPGISNCCNGRNYSQSAGGFGWRFAKEKVKTES